MDCVNPFQPTQSRNVGVAAMQGGNVHWNETLSSSPQSIRVDGDEYVEVGQHNVNVGLTL